MSSVVKFKFWVFGRHKLTARKRFQALLLSALLRYPRSATDFARNGSWPPPSAPGPRLSSFTHERYWSARAARAGPLVVVLLRLLLLLLLLLLRLLCHE